MTRKFISASAFAALVVVGVLGEDSGWPRLFKTDGAEVLVYQPQVDSWQNHESLEFRMATSVKRATDEQPTFGVITIAAKTKVNHEERTVLLTELESKVHIPDVDAGEAQALAEIVRAAIPRRETLEVDLDRVLSYVELSEFQAHEVEVNLDPPPIFHSAETAILVIFLGEPKFKPIENTNLLFAINTNWDLFLETDGSRYFLLDEDEWLTTQEPSTSVWEPAKELPADLAKLPDDDNWSEVNQHIPGKPATKPARVFVSNQPAELIVTIGEPELAPIPGSNLLYVTNTESDLFMNSEDGRYYFLVAGRWFRAEKLEGPWSAATADLPGGFAKIPEEHAKGGILSSVPGTPEAEEAVIQASIPHRATVQRSQVSVTVTYDGKPRLKPIDGCRGVSYAVNTTFTVLSVNDQYYCCENGLWFVSPKPEGPWIVCVEVPKAIYTIPASSPLHNVTYVYVYDSDPDEVTVGYTAGYTGAYIANGLLMFGAGMALGHALADDDEWCRWRYSSCYYSYGCAAHYSYYHGSFVRAANCYGPYGGAGFGARYNPVTGRYARGAYAYGPYGSAGIARAYNPVTGTRTRGAYASGPRGTVAGGSAFNPRTGRSAATRQVRTPYGSWGRSVVSDGDDWARFGHRSGAAGKTAGFETSGGAKGIVHKGEQGWTYLGKGSGGDVYAGHDGRVYRRGDNNEWQRHSNATRQWSGTGTRSYDAAQARTRPEHWHRGADGMRSPAVNPTPSGPRVKEQEPTAGRTADQAGASTSRGEPPRRAVREREVRNRESARSGDATRRLSRDSWSRDRGNRLSGNERRARGGGFRGRGRR